jgi:hypothetical protein
VTSQITNATAPRIVSSQSPRTVTSAMNVTHSTSEILRSIGTHL